MNKNKEDIFRLLPLAITQSGVNEACVGALTNDGYWVRPQPISLTLIRGKNSGIQYGHWFTVQAKKENRDGSRPEDYHIIKLHGITRKALETEIMTLIDSFLDNSVSDIFVSTRSLGVISATIKEIYIKYSTGNKKFCRMLFSDIENKLYDWIVPDIRFSELIFHNASNDTINQDFYKCLINQLGLSTVYLTVGLTKPNYKFPGLFHGCHPLVVGVHIFPSITTICGAHITTSAL